MAYLHVTPENVQSLAFGRWAPPGQTSELAPALVAAAARLAPRTLFLPTEHERAGAAVFCAYVSSTRFEDEYAEVLHIARVGGTLKIVGMRAVNPFKADKLAWDTARGDPFKGLGKPTAIVKLVRPTLELHAAHYDGQAPAAHRS